MVYYWLLLFTGEDDEIFDVGSAREEIVGLDGGDGVLIKEEFDVAGLGGRIAGEVDDLLWGDFEEFMNKLRVAASARRVQNNGLS